MYARVTLTILLGLSFFICNGQDTIGVYKEVIPGITSCETINIRKHSNFIGISFKDDALFPCNQFVNVASFRSTQFKSLADFYNAEFHSRAYFRLAHFHSRAYFRSTQFKSLTDFYNTQFDSRAYFRLAQFNSRTDFSLTQFKSLADFYNAQFDAQVYFRLAKFDSLADFSSIHFHALANFSSTHFYSQADFRNTQYDAQADFIDAQFDSRTDFYNSHFHDIAEFTSTYFYDKANFHNTKLDSLASFRSAHFHALVNFNSAYFHTKANFQNTHFNSSADFSQASFNGKTNFRGVILPDTLFFNDIKEIRKGEIIDFTFSKLDTFHTYCAIDLVDTEISKVKLNYHRFQLIFPDTNYTYFKKCSTYEQLLETQHNYGFTTGYEKLDKEYQEFKYLNLPRNNSSLIARYVNYIANTFQKHWWDYGYKKVKVVWWSLFFWFIFSIVNWLLFNQLNKGVYEIDYVYTPLKKYGKFNINLQQILPAVIYTALIFFGIKMSVEKINYKNKVGVIYIYFQYILGLVCLAYIANFIIFNH